MNLAPDQKPKQHASDAEIKKARDHLNHGAWVCGALLELVGHALPQDEHRNYIEEAFEHTSDLHFTVKNGLALLVLAGEVSNHKLLLESWKTFSENSAASTANNRLNQFYKALQGVVDDLDRRFPQGLTISVKLVGQNLTAE